MHQFRSSSPISTDLVKWRLRYHISCCCPNRLHFVEFSCRQQFHCQQPLISSQIDLPVSRYHTNRFIDCAQDNAVVVQMNSRAKVFLDRWNKKVRKHNWKGKLLVKKKKKFWHSLCWSGAAVLRSEKRTVWWPCVHIQLLLRGKRVVCEVSRTGPSGSITIVTWLNPEEVCVYFKSLKVQLSPGSIETQVTRRPRALLPVLDIYIHVGISIWLLIQNKGIIAMFVLSEEDLMWFF